jgi:hypothetical protein
MRMRGLWFPIRNLLVTASQTELAIFAGSIRPLVTWGVVDVPARCES